MMVSIYPSSLPGDWYRQKAFGDTNSDTRAAYFEDEEESNKENEILEQRKKGRNKATKKESL
jgi:hypothetical protein